MLKDGIQLGTNVVTKVVGNILTIEVDLSKESGLTDSNKSYSIATTGGNQTIPGYENMVKLGVNVYRPNPAYVKPPRQ